MFRDSELNRLQRPLQELDWAGSGGRPTRWEFGEDESQVMTARELYRFKRLTLNPVSGRDAQQKQ